MVNKTKKNISKSNSKNSHAKKKINVDNKITPVAFTGAQAAAQAMKQINPDVVAAYPITPQSPIVETFSKFYSNGDVDTEFVPVESEHSAMSVVVGSSAAGARSMTATSSVGLALMFEVVNAASGMRLPIVMNVVNRALSSPINIHCDHSDSMACKDAGWVQIYSEDAQEVYENNFLAMRISENPDVMLPTMVMQDGFITSHSKQNMVLYPQSKIKKLIGTYKPKNYLLKGEPVTFGSLALTDYFFEIKRQQEEGMRNVFDAFKKAAKELKEITGKNYEFIETYKTNDAQTILVALNSTIGTSRVVVDKLRKQGKKVGLLKIRLFRPFPYQTIAKALSKCENLIVLDRSMSFGAFPPLASEMINVIHEYNLRLNMQNYIYGLGGREIYEEDIENIFRVSKTKKVRNEFIGLRE